MIEPPHSMRDLAVALSKQGFRVFKLMVNGKKPAITNFPEIASSDPKKVHQMWTEPVTGDSLYNNIGILTGGDFFVVDIDVKDGKKGLETLDLLIDQGFTTETKTARSPTGSLHYYFALPDGTETRNTVNKLGPGIDTRGYHGFVVAPGSVTKDGIYEWFDDQEMADAQDWIVERILARKAPELDSATQLTSLDDAGAISRAVEYLKNSAPSATLRDGSNTTTYQVAARIKDFGVSAQSALELMLEHWNEQKSNPPWPVDKLLTVIENAYRYGASPPGVSSAHADFTAVADQDNAPPAAQQKRNALFMRSFEEACKRSLTTAANPLIKGFLDTCAFSVIYGESGAGKTFVTLDIAFHIATGRPWAGRKTIKGPVLYIAAEAGEDINARMEALRRQYSPTEPPMLYVIPCLVDLFDPKADLRPLLKLIAEAEERMGQKFVLIVIDTLARSMGSGDENSTQDMNLMVRHFDHLRVATRSHVMVVHHSGKNKAAGARGSSALRAATDTEIEIAPGLIEVKKQRSSSMGKPVRFDLREVLIGEDEDGERVTSCTVRLRDGADTERPELSPGEQSWLDAMEAEAEGSELTNVEDFVFTLEILQRIFRAENDPALVLKRQTVQTRMLALTEKCRVRKIERGQWVLR